jgi:hypothetical protein
MDATRVCGSGGDFAGELGERVTALVVLGGDRRERADRTRKDDPVRRMGQFVGAAELIESACGRGDALGEGRVRWGTVEGDAASYRAKETDEIAVWDPVAEHAEEARGERRIGGGEFGLGGWCDAVLVSWFAAGRAVTGVALDESIAFEEGELRADSRGRDAEGLGEFVGGGGVAEQLVEDLGPGVTERSSDPAGNWHETGIECPYGGLALQTTIVRKAYNSNKTINYDDIKHIRVQGLTWN